MQNCPRWVDLFIKLVRPGALFAMVALLVLGGFLFAIVEFIFPTQGARAADVFVGFFRAMDDNYYTTVQVMFTAYVFGRSGQAIAEKVSDAKVKTAEVQNNAEPAG